jgi:hypothetical protein
MLKLPVRGRLAQVVYFNAAIAANSFGALVTLVLNGYGHDATRIARGLYEAAVNALYLQLHPTEVDDFVDFNWVKQKRLYDYFQTLAAPDLAKLPQEALERLVSEYERVKEKFDNSRGKSRSTWCKKSLRQRAEEVDYGQYYPTFYAIASGIHHGDITGMLSQSEEDALTVTTPPSYEGIKMALMLAHNLLILAFKVLNEVSDFGMHHEISDAEEGFKRAWGTDR